MDGTALIRKYFPDLSTQQQKQFNLLGFLYRDWNSKINLISRKDIDHLYERHVLHSLGIAKVISFKPGTRILDAGTGGGFPGIPLAVLFPECRFHLVDSIGKKIKAVHAIANALELKNVKAEQKRAEALEEKYDFVVSRAVTELPEFYSWVKDKISPGSSNEIPNGILYLKGGEIMKEAQGAGMRIKEYALRDFFSEEFFDTKKVIRIT